MLVLAKLALGATAATAVAAGAICSEGFINLSISEHSGDEHHHIHVIAPAALVPIAVYIVPADKLNDAAEKLRPFLPAIDAAATALRDSPDTTLVEVSDPDDYVHIEKSGEGIVIDVADREATVHISVPLRAVASTAHALGSKIL